MMIYFLYLKQAVAAQEQNLPIVFQNKVGQTKTKSLEFELGQDFQTVKHTWGHLPPMRKSFVTQVCKKITGSSYTLVIQGFFLCLTHLLSTNWDQSGDKSN